MLEACSVAHVRLDGITVNLLAVIGQLGVLRKRFIAILTPKKNIH
jgi:hypothetical protein